jgi:7-cyano-7-deazaguanine tRNA-ribosyltransferase
MQAHAHPSLLQALKKLNKYKDFIEKHDVAAKNSGLFIFNSVDLMRPEVVRHKKRLEERYIPPKAQILLLAPQTRMKPFHKSIEFKQVAGFLQDSRKHSDKVHICFYAAPFGVIPYELDEVYPLSQHETALPLDNETVNCVADQVTRYISRINCKMVVLLDDPQNWGKTVLETVKKTCLKENIRFQCINVDKKKKEASTTRLDRILRET